MFRAARPETREELEDYQALLARGLVRPRRLEIYLMRADGTGVTQVTRAGAASFAPFLHPNGQLIVFSSNLHDPTGRSFALYIANVDGSGLTRVTWGESFASFPMFSRDGRTLVFCGNRNAASPREMNVFVADWVAKPSAGRPGGSGDRVALSIGRRVILDAVRVMTPVRCRAPVDGAN